MLSSCRWSSTQEETTESWDPRRGSYAPSDRSSISGGRSHEYDDAEEQEDAYGEPQGVASSSTSGEMSTTLDESNVLSREMQITSSLCGISALALTGAGGAGDLGLDVRPSWERRGERCAVLKLKDAFLSETLADRLRELNSQAAARSDALDGVRLKPFMSGVRAD